jgi:hypothetical protein
MDGVVIFDSNDWFMLIGIPNRQQCTPGGIEKAVDIANLDDWGLPLNSETASIESVMN